jgi:hypothetical protein
MTTATTRQCRWCADVAPDAGVTAAAPRRLVDRFIPRDRARAPPIGGAQVVDGGGWATARARRSRSIRRRASWWWCAWPRGRQHARGDGEPQRDDRAVQDGGGIAVATLDAVAPAEREQLKAAGAQLARAGPRLPAFMYVSA